MFAVQARRRLWHERGERQRAPWSRLEMQSQYPWDLVRPDIEASLRTPLLRVPISLNTCAWPGWVEVPRTATRESLGTISFRSSSRFPLISGAMRGQSRDVAARPRKAGDEPSCQQGHDRNAITMGIVPVASLAAARVACGPRRDDDVDLETH